MSATSEGEVLNESSRLTSNSKQHGNVDLKSLFDDVRTWVKKTCRQLYPTGFIKELKSLLKLSLPILAVLFCMMAFTLTPLYFGGHLRSTVEFDAVSLSICIVDATVVAMSLGMSTACNTYTAQAYSCGEKRRIGLFVQTACYLTLLTLLPLIALHINIDSILYALGQNLATSRLVGEYISVLIPGTISFYFFQVLDKYMIAQGYVLPSMLSMIIAALLNVVLHYILVQRLRLGIIGSSLSLSLSFIFLSLFMFSVIKLRKLHTESWTGFRLESLRYLVPYSKLAYSGMFFECSEYWIYEIGIFLSGYLSQEELAAQSIVTNLDLCWAQVPMSFNIAVVVLTGQYISVSNVDGVKTVQRVALTVMLLLIVIYSVNIMIWKNELTAFFTDKREVSELAATFMLILAIYIFTDGICLILLGSLLGIGRQFLAFITTLIGYYVISVPLGILLMFVSPLRSKGYFIGIGVGNVVKLVIVCVIVYFIDWQEEVENAKKRVSNTEMDSEENTLSSNLLANQSNETLSIENATSTPRSCIQRLSEVLLTGDTYAKAVQIGMPVTMIVIFLVGIIIRITVQIPEIHFDLYAFNKSTNNSYGL